MTEDGQHSPQAGRVRWVVLKFGGTSVSSLERWQTIRRVLEARLAEGLRPLVVCSALSQVSNQLEHLLDEAGQGHETAPALDAFRATHRSLAAALGVDVDALCGELFEDLERTLLGIALTMEVTPRLRARVLATGELLSTRLGVAWLRAQGVPAVWQDAREILEAQREPPSALGDERQYLSATCDDAADSAVDRRLSALDGEVVITQGFIARGPDDDTVLLGRGGSDTSAAYFAAILDAQRLEIWTDVPGIFTANPGQVPDARLLRKLGYAEAGELAARGAKVLHPRCLGPVRARGIPLHLCWTARPDFDGTRIAGDTTHGRAGILGVVARKDLVVVNMDLEGAWQRVGVIADVASCFRDLGLSIDLLASSQTHITVALDPAANQLDQNVLDTLMRELATMGDPRVGGRATSVSLVGTSLADVLHELGPLLENFEHENVQLVSHAANDLSLSVVVGGDASDALMQGIHEKLFGGGRLADFDLGPTWAELQPANASSPAAAASAP